MNCRTCCFRPGLSMIEVVLSTAIVGTLLASVLSVVGVAAQRSTQADDSEHAAWLARDLAAEIASKPCAWLSSGSGSTDLQILLTNTGLTSYFDNEGATALEDRTAFNDIFDYDNWTSTPPVDANGFPIAGYTGWTRSVDVDAIDPATLSQRTFNDDAAMITVTVSKNGKILHTETLIRTQATDVMRGFTPPDTQTQQNNLFNTFRQKLFGG